MVGGLADKKQNWVIAQRWSHVLFLSFRSDPKLIRQQIPSELDVDTHDGSAWLSIVPFRMSHIRFRFMPTTPSVSLWELNLRTYVSYQGRPGIYFFTLDTDSWLGQKIAKYCFHLPYRFRKMEGRVSEADYYFESPESFRVAVDLNSEVESSVLDKWLVERYHLYTATKKHLYRGDVLHDPWLLRQVEVKSYEDMFSPQFGFDPMESIHMRYSKSLNVRFRPFVKLF